MQTISDVPRLTPLPSIENPFFVFLGVKEDGKTLVFLVSSDAKATGDGKCQPKDTCETIEMQAGDTEIFDAHDRRRRVQQYQMDVVKVSKVKATSAKAARTARARHSKAGAALLTIAREDATAPDLLGHYRWDPKRGVLDVVKRRPRSHVGRSPARSAPWPADRLGHPGRRGPPASLEPRAPARNIAGVRSFRAALPVTARQ